MEQENVQTVAQRIQEYFRDRDKSDDFTYLSWEKLSDNQKKFWVQCASFVFLKE
jgi:hypothetical protein